MNKFLITTLFYFFVIFGLTQNSTIDNDSVKFYYKNGKVSSQGVLRDGKPDGYWKTYYENGVLKSEGNRLFYQLDSTWKFYADNGMLVEIISYKNNVKNGPNIKYNKEGFIISNDFYKDNQKDSLSLLFYDNGAIHLKIPFLKGREEGTGYEYDLDWNINSIIIYKDGFIDKKEKLNRRDEDGLKIGLWKEFYPTSLIVKEEGYYVKGQKNGYFKLYNRFGKLTKTEK